MVIVLMATKRRKKHKREWVENCNREVKSAAFLLPIPDSSQLPLVFFVPFCG